MKLDKGHTRVCVQRGVALSPSHDSPRVILGERDAMECPEMG